MDEENREKILTGETNGSATEPSHTETVDHEPGLAGSGPETDAETGRDEDAASVPEDEAPSEPIPALVAEKVGLWYRDVIAVNDLTVRIEPGITGLLGLNGAGKSTLIKMAVGLLRPASGRIRILGEDPWNNAELLGRIGYLPEAPAPWREESGREAARRAARLAGIPEAEVDARVETAIERVGLQNAAERRVGTYSHGMQQRLKFALALLNDPELLILDEPLLGADPLARRDLIQLMQELAKEGKSILLSTHVLPDVEALTDRILVMDRGRLLAHGAVGEIREMLEQYPRTVRIGTDDPRALGAAIWSWPSVISLQAERDAVVVRTDRPVDFFPELQRLLLDQEMPFTSISIPDDSVEAVFKYLVG
jgi:ABC-2 type transport system ATP-binding protein